MILINNPIFRNTAIQLIGKTVNTGADLLVTLFITRFLGAQGYGDFTKVFTLIALLYLFLDFGFNAVTVRRLGSKSSSLSSEFSLLLTARIFYAFILFTLLCVFLLIIPTAPTDGYTFPVKSAIFIFGFSLFSQAVFTSVNALFQHRLDYFPVVFSGTLGTLIGSLAVLASLFFSPNLLTVILAHLFGSLVMATFSFIFVSRLVPISLHADWPALRHLILETAPIGIMLFINALMIRLDSIIVTLTRSTLEVGWLGLAYRIYDNLLIIPLFCLNALYPVMISRRQSSPLHLRLLIWRAGKFLLIISLLLAFLLFVSTPLLVIFGQAMLPASPALKLLSFSLPFFFLTSLLQWTMLTLHQEQLLIKVYALGLFFNASLNLIAIPRFGYLAAALTTGLTELLIFLLLLPPVLKSFKLTKADHGT